jgi:hypothetical protein
MKLSTIARGILNEDAPMSPAQAPATATPASTEKFYDVLNDFQGFETIVDKQTETAKKNLESSLSKNLLNKTATFRASKGAVGQVEKDYTITVTGVGVSQLKDEYFIVLRDKEKKDYFVNTGFKIKVSDATEDTSSSSTDSPQASAVAPEQGKGNSRNVGGIVYPQNMGLGSNKNTVSP